MNKKLAMQELQRMSVNDFHAAEKIPLILVLDNIRSGLNVGSIFRSADAFRVQQIICCGYTPAPPHREVLKTALGATETVAWKAAEQTTQAVQELKNMGVKCYALEQALGSIALHEFAPQNKQPMALVLGNEVTGVAQGVIDICNGCIEITQHGTKHSLNVSVCAGIVIYDMFQKYHFSPLQ
jgi:tRNA G18 (ribose-2'-O)-methylase SpoU